VGLEKIIPKCNKNIISLLPHIVSIRCGAMYFLYHIFSCANSTATNLEGGKVLIVESIKAAVTIDSTECFPFCNIKQQSMIKLMSIDF